MNNIEHLMRFRGLQNVLDKQPVNGLPVGGMRVESNHDKELKITGNRCLCCHLVLFLDALRAVFRTVQADYDS